MSDDDIDFDRVVSDPSYRREIIAFLKSADEILAELGEDSSAVFGGDAQPRP